MYKRLFEIVQLFKEYFLLGLFLVASIALLTFNENQQIRAIRSVAVASVGFHPAGFSLVSVLVAPHVRPLAVSLVLVVGTLVGAGLLPTGIGYFAEAFSFSAAISLLGLVTLAAVPLLLRI